MLIPAQFASTHLWYNLGKESSPHSLLLAASTSKCGLEVQKCECAPKYGELRIVSEYDGFVCYGYQTQDRTPPTTIHCFQHTTHHLSQSTQHTQGWGIILCLLRNGGTEGRTGTKKLHVRGRQAKSVCCITVLSYDRQTLDG